MSGGQKQRIELARSVYNDADIYLLDDPFSAVETHTAATLFNVMTRFSTCRCISNPYLVNDLVCNFQNCVMSALEKKTVVLVTHQVEFLAEVDKILVVESGKVVQSGSYEDILSAGTAFERLVSAHKNSMTVLDSANSGQGGDQQTDHNHSNPTKQNNEEEISVNGITGVQLTEEEEMDIGDVGWKHFLDYLKVSKGFLILNLSTFCQIAFIPLQAASTYCWNW